MIGSHKRVISLSRLFNHFLGNDFLWKCNPCTMPSIRETVENQPMRAHLKVGSALEMSEASERHNPKGTFQFQQAGALKQNTNLLPLTAYNTNGPKTSICFALFLI